jgi:hypothetical protein
MSDLGVIEKGGEAYSAWTFRGIYQKYGHKYDMFFCPFCDIRLTACVIYNDGDSARSPYFSARHGEHIFPCDGQPIETGARSTIKPIKNRHELTEITCPEAFTDRQPPRKTLLVQPNTPTPTGMDINKRRRNAGTLGRVTAKTYLLQAIVEARNIMISDVFKRGKEFGWSNEKRGQLIDLALKDKPLQLIDATNYKDAFRTFAYIHFKMPRIYYGTGFISLRSNGFVICSQFLRKTNNVIVHGEIQVNIESISETSPKSHATLVGTLSELASTKKEIRWFAYGLAQMNADKICVKISNLDYVFVKPKF